ncbi:hypothetical protein CDAR_589561 [Caerostris darwini]|uniref:Uncharacterized protein n=1 Tax=Caerostris darwini TaxID=1538125 RepID=A0AAV4UJT5_9ARAC|nr:hypothetical protein CDAR_589561 [Caerostris darwini]
MYGEASRNHHPVSSSFCGNERNSRSANLDDSSVSDVGRAGIHQRARTLLPARMQIRTGTQPHPGRPHPKENAGAFDAPRSKGAATAPAAKKDFRPTQRCRAITFKSFPH